MREEGRVVSKAVYLAQGVNEANKREIIGFWVSEEESKEAWLTFLQSLRARGLSQPTPDYFRRSFRPQSRYPALFCRGAMATLRLSFLI